MNRDPDFLLERLDQAEGRVRTTKPGHVLNRQHVRAHFLQLLRELEVILERVLGVLRLDNIARVTDGGFANRVRVLHGLHRDRKIRRVVERIENAENINAGGSRVLHEAGDDVVGIIRIPYRIRPPEQHLKTDVWNFFPQLPEALPGILAQKAHGRIERRAAPHLEAEELWRASRDRIRDGEHVETADARGQERLVRVAERSVGHQQSLLLERPLREFLRAQFKQKLARAWRGSFLMVVARRRGFWQRTFWLVPFNLRVAIDDDVGKKIQELGGAIALGFKT